MAVLGISIMHLRFMYSYWVHNYIDLQAAFSQYKKQKMFFDEKEAKLLKLYQT